MNGDGGRVGILMGGGPAPGINSAISSATIEAVNQGYDVVGILDGFSHLMKGRTDMTLPLTIQDVSQIHHRGGSIIRTSRQNPTRRTEDLDKTVSALRKLGISYLVTIGGDDTAFSASEVSRHAGSHLRVAHIPKTIDNDLPLPGNMPTFGYETARHLGTELVRNLIEDFRTTNRWYFVTAMGRAAGHLALGIGKSAAATLTIIPEEFTSDLISLREVCDVLETAIFKRRVMGKERGLAVVAEGLAERFDPEELQNIPGAEVSRDQHGPLRLGDIQLEKALRREIQSRFAARERSGDNRQQRRLRVALVPADTVRHRLHPQPGLRSRQIPVGGVGPSLEERRRADLLGRWPNRGGAFRPTPRSCDRPHPRAHCGH